VKAISHVGKQASNFIKQSWFKKNQLKGNKGASDGE
jgi:hypothetical protein